MSDLPRVGEPFDEKPPVFELRVSDHITDIDPSKYSLTDVDAIDPNDFFITSGDAVEKTRVLEKKLWKLAGDLRKQSYVLLANERKTTVAKAQVLYRKGKRPKAPAEFSNYEAAVWKAAGQSRRMLNALLLAKGEDCFLETEWENHRLLCIPKNPRR